MGEISSQVKSDTLTWTCKQKIVEFFMEYWEDHTKNGRLSTPAMNHAKCDLCIKSPHIFIFDILFELP